jgi:hypothetical protein
VSSTQTRQNESTHPNPSLTVRSATQQCVVLTFPRRFQDDFHGRRWPPSALLLSQCRKRQRQRLHYMDVVATGVQQSSGAAGGHGRCNGCCIRCLVAAVRVM